MPADHNDDLHDWAGAYALGALDPGDRRRFERHLADCPRCATEIRALAPIPGLLAQLDSDDLDASIRPETADAISRRVQHDTQQLRTSRNRWRLTAITTAAAIVIALIAAVALGSNDSPNDTVATVAASVTSSLAESTDVTTTTRGWGTQIDLDLTGLPNRPRYQLWAIDDEGSWSVAATWGPTPTGRATITGATATPTTQLGRLVVTSDDPDDIIIDASI